MGGSYHIAVPGHRTATMAAPLTHCGPAKYEAGLHFFFFKLKKCLLVFCVCLFMKGCMQGMVWIEPDTIRVDAACDGESPI